MSNSKKNKIPHFSSEDQEREFWSTHDSSEYMDWTQAEKMEIPNLRPTVRSISLRLPEALLERLKVLANKKDVPYQSLMKIYLSERVEEETSRPRSILRRSRSMTRGKQDIRNKLFELW